MIRTMPIQVLWLLRPHHWIKNITVFTGVVFGYGWQNPEKVVLATIAFVGFCLISSSVYIVNDMFDREQDRLHPIRRHRPLATGALTLPAAAKLLLVTGLVGMLLSFANTSLLTGEIFTWCFSMYVVLNIVYNASGTKNDLSGAYIVATGFLMRLLAGTLGIGIANESLWLVACGFAFAMFLAIAKRHAAGNSSQELASSLTIFAAMSIAAYCAFAVSAGTLVSALFVTYGVCRYLYLLKRRRATEDVMRDTVRDAHLLIAVIGWTLSVGAITRMTT